MSQDPSVEVCERVAAIIDAEFSGEGWTTEHDTFGRSMGKDLAEDEARIAVHPYEERSRADRFIELHVPVTVQFHLGFVAEPNEEYARDPREVAAYAGRFRRAFDATAGDDTWFIKLLAITYPPDPTGNTTRFEATVEGIGTNQAALG